MAFFKTSMSPIIVVVAFCLFSWRPALAQDTAFPFCFDGSYTSVDSSISYDFFDLVIDADTLIGKEFVVVSHVAVLRQNSSEILAEVGPIHCNPMFGRAMVKKGGLSIIISPALLRSSDDYKRIRRSVIENTDSFKSLSLFQITGVMNFFSDTGEPVLEVKDLIPISSN